MASVTSRDTRARVHRKRNDRHVHKKRHDLWLPLEDALTSSPYHLRPGPSHRESVNRHKAMRKDEPHTGNMHLTAPFVESTRKRQRPPAPLPASTSADLRECPSAVVKCGAGRVEHWILPLRLEAMNSTLEARPAVIDTGIVVLQALREGGASWNGSIEGGSWDGSSHGVAGVGQERQTQKRSDQQGET